MPALFFGAVHPVRATYLFDLASAADAEQEDRTVAAWAVTPAAVARQDVSYQRGFPLAADLGAPRSTGDT